MGLSCFVAGGIYAISTKMHSFNRQFTLSFTLLQDEKWSKDFDPKLQNLLRELEAGLGSVLRRTDNAEKGTKYREDDVQGT